ncbi:hypothetical protein S83_046304 [Arachis hypogaea]
MLKGRRLWRWKLSLIPYGNIELPPSAGILNYGQGVLEGLKAYRTKDGSIVLFRPEENARRIKIRAERMCMPSPSVEQFLVQFFMIFCKWYVSILNVCFFSVWLELMTDRRVK